MRGRTLLLLSMTAGLTGCYADPYQNPGDWSLTGAARQNLAAQAANPADLISGHGESATNGVAAAAAVDKALGGAAGTAAGLQAPPVTLTTGGS